MFSAGCTGQVSALTFTFQKKDNTALLTAFSFLIRARKVTIFLWPAPQQLTRHGRLHTPPICGAVTDTRAARAKQASKYVGMYKKLTNTVLYRNMILSRAAYHQRKSRATLWNPTPCPSLHNNVWDKSQTLQGDNYYLRICRLSSKLFSMSNYRSCNYETQRTFIQPHPAFLASNVSPSKFLAAKLPHNIAAALYIGFKFALSTYKFVGCSVRAAVFIMQAWRDKLLLGEKYCLPVDVSAVLGKVLQQAGCRRLYVEQLCIIYSPQGTI